MTTSQKCSKLACCIWRIAGLFRSYSILPIVCWSAVNRRWPHSPSDWVNVAINAVALIVFKNLHSLRTTPKDRIARRRLIVQLARGGKIRQHLTRLHYALDPKLQIVHRNGQFETAITSPDGLPLTLTMKPRA